MASQDIAKLVVQLEADIRSLKTSLTEGDRLLGKHAKKSETSLASIAKHWKGIAISAAAAIYAIRNFTKTYTEFTTKMREVNTLLDVTDKRFNRLSKDIINLTRVLPQTAQELAAAEYDVISAGVALDKSIKVLELSGKAAVAGVTDTKTAAATGIAVVNAYGKSIDELEEVYDVLFQTVRKGVTTFPELAQYIGVVLPVARAAGVSFEDVAASIATMTKAGIQTPRATTFLRSGIAALSAPTKEAQKAMKEMGITWQGWLPTLEQISRKVTGLDQMRKLIPDIRAAQGVLSLAQNLDTLHETVAEIAGAAGSMETAYDKMKDTPENQIKLLSNAFTELKLAIVELGGTDVLHILEKLRAAIRGLVDSKVLTLLRAEIVAIQTLARLRLAPLQAKTIIEDASRQIRELFKETEEEAPVGARPTAMEGLGLRGGRSARAVAALGAGPVTPAPIPAAATEEEREKQIARQVAAEKAALAEYLAEVKYTLAQVDIAYKQGQYGVEDYYAVRKYLASEALDAEIAALEKLLKVEKDEAKQIEIRGEIRTKEIAKQQRIVELNAEETKAIRQATKARREANVVIAEAEARGSIDWGVRYHADLIALQDKQTQEIEALRQHNATVEQMEELRRAHEREREKFHHDYMNSLQVKRLELARQVASGMISAFDQLYEASGEKMKAFFYLSKAAALAEAIINTELAVTKALAEGGKAGAILAALVRLQGGMSIAAIVAQTLQGPGFAEGGEVQGPGGRDRVGIRATRGEYMQPVSSVQHYGLGVMEALRQRSIPRDLLRRFSIPRIHAPGGRFAEGGMVAGSEEGQAVNIVNMVDPHLFAQYVASPEGSRSIINLVAKYPYEFRRALSK